MTTNISLAIQCFQKILETGGSEFCICAGARNSPLLYVLEALKNENASIQTYTFFDERAAAFFALGRSQNTKTPVTVITTSGTAVAELLPSCIEAHYSGTPIIFLTADRPPSYRGTGAPQSIKQNNLLTEYVFKVFDCFQEIDIDLSYWEQKQPLHINICFDEPLVDESIDLKQIKSIAHLRKTPQLKKSLKLQSQNLDQIKDFFKVHKNPLVLFGPNQNSAADNETKNFFIQSNLPVHHEALSNFHLVASNILLGGEASVDCILKNNWCDSIVRLGGVPTLRTWRDLEIKFKNLPVLNVCDLNFSGLSRPSLQMTHQQFKQISTELELSKRSVSNKNFETIQKYDSLIFKKSQNLIEKYPKSEMALVSALTRIIPKDSHLYLGNSLPIRFWNWLNPNSQLNTYTGNRGANGIDGQISSFFGHCRDDKENWALLGDLTALYDSNAPWIINQIPNLKFHIVIMNNRGAHIFTRMFRDCSFFTNEHNLNFEHWSQHWGINYFKGHSPDELFEKSKKTLFHKEIMELVPCPQQTANFWKDWDTFIKTELPS